MKFYSHVDMEGYLQKELKDHLIGVAKDAKSSIEEIPLKDKKLIAEIAYLIGISHDFGKYTSFFQEHLLEKRDWGRKSHHSFISALFAAWQIQKYIEKNDVKERIYSYLPLIGYFVVLHHHGDLGSLETDIPTSQDLKNPPMFPRAESNLREKLKTMYNQVENLKQNERLRNIEKEYSEIRVVDKIENFLNSWMEVLKNLSKLNQSFKYKKLSNNEKIFISFLTLLLYSVLIDADKRDAGETTKIERKFLSPDLADKYREKCFDLRSNKPINLIRNEIYGSVTVLIEKVPLENHLFTITAPTGSGKTLTAFSAALKLRNRIEKEKGYSPRIIYSLPFITIIEQNYKVIYDVLSSQIKNFKENETAYLLKHHYLTDLRYKEGNEERPIDKALLLTESWQTEIIVTTFIQLLHTIIGFKNGFLKKYHNIAGSIILLDEVQNIPVEYWNLVRKVILLLSEYFGCYFILLTATKPLILNEGETLELVENTQNYFRKLNRVIIKPNMQKVEIDEFIEWFVSNYDAKKSYLLVANTIRSSKEIYQKIRDTGLNNHLFYLSTSIVPKQRGERIRAIKDLLDRGNKVIVVSTQVIEAGVDLDFDIVIRDVGPIDSIIQVAGRCNREYGKDKSEVYVFYLDNFASYVYGKIHPDISKKLLLENRDITEDHFYEITNRYFEEVKPKINDDISKYIWEAMLELRYHGKNPPQRNGHNVLVSEFQLIDEKGEYIDIFVELDDEAKRIWEKYCKQVYNEKDFLTQRYAYLSIRREFRNYIISVRRDKKIILPAEVCGLRYIPKEQLEDFYSIETGFKTDTLIW